jgi:L-amino acid N-acyltransferase YncA
MTSLLDDMVAAHGRWTAARLSDWYPQDQRRERSRDAMQGQAGWVADADFGLSFRDNVGSVPVSDPLAWANRRIDLSDGHWCVTGIRFRGRDVTKPFIDVVATSLPPRADALARLAAVLVPQYRDFAPRAVRVDAPAPDELVGAAMADPRFAHAAVDQYVVAGLVADLRRRPPVDGYERVHLQVVPVDPAGQATARLYAQAEAERPDLAQWATPSTPDELQECAAEGLLFEVRVDGHPAGVVAARRDDDHGMTGFVVQEIVLDDAHRGHRLAAAVLQRLLAELPAGPGDTLWGTIHPDNQPSLRNAASIGREIVGGFVWLTPQGLTGL